MNCWTAGNPNIIYDLYPTCRSTSWLQPSLERGSTTARFWPTRVQRKSVPTSSEKSCWSICHRKCPTHSHRWLLSTHTHLCAGRMFSLQEDGDQWETSDTETSTETGDTETDRETSTQRPAHTAFCVLWVSLRQKLKCFLWFTTFQLELSLQTFCSCLRLFIHYTHRHTFL